jgi:tetratricopeptide (TPR) repeat protein
MPSLPMGEIGEIIRKTRKERGLRLEDLADEYISKATISNIERGIPHVSKERTLYLLQKLNIATDHLPKILAEQQREWETLKNTLFYIECLCDSGQPKKALERLNASEAEEHPLYAAKGYFIRGKCLFELGKTDKAMDCYEAAIKLASTNPLTIEMNVATMAYLNLGLCYYQKNDFSKALEVTQMGLKRFHPKGERPSLEFNCYRNIAIYQERLGLLAESLHTVLKVWNRRHELNDNHILLGLYWLRAELARKSGLLKDAIRYCYEGLEIARYNENHSMMLDLWTVLGSVYLSTGEWDWARDCFQAALDLPSAQTSIRTATTYTRKGVLHMMESQFTKAEQALEQAIRISTIHNDAPRLSRALMVMGDLHQKQGNLPLAQSYYESTLDLCQKHGFRKMEQAVLLRLPDFWKRKNQSRYLDLVEEIT